MVYPVNIVVDGRVTEKITGRHPLPFLVLSINLNTRLFVISPKGGSQDMGHNHAHIHIHSSHLPPRPTEKISTPCL